MLSRSVDQDFFPPPDSKLRRRRLQERNYSITAVHEVSQNILERAYETPVQIDASVMIVVGI
jgi:hypothetical protein